MARRRSSRASEGQLINEPQSCEVDSTAIKHIGYDANSGSLAVTFTNDRSYIYSGVSPQRYAAFCNADSKGRYVNKSIKGNYPYRRVG